LRKGMEEKKAYKLHLYASRPAAGFPAPGDDLVEKSLDINDLVIKNPAATFFVRVEGESMKGAGIVSGDVLVVDRSVEVCHGRIVVAAVCGELVVKKIGMCNGEVALVSENDAFDPIMLSADEECHIWGVVVGSVRAYN
jgi:DNA polymerase V